MQPAYYEDFEEIKNKIWSMFDNAIKDRGSQFRITVFVCGGQDVVVALNFADVFLRNVQRVRVPLVQVRDKELSAFQSFHQPM